MTESTYTGGCFCGAVQIKVTGRPEAMGYCHCNSCRSWAAAPVNAFTLWKPENVTVTQGKDKIGVFHKTEHSHRQFCRVCGGHLMTAHPGMNLIDVYAAIIPDVGFEPMLHVHYGEKVLPVRDGLPKFKDLPGEFGGSGETLAES
jgi:hypothetical protein